MRNLLAVSLLLAGCHPEPPPEPPVDAPDIARSDVLSVKAVPNPDLDVLFVVDDSPSMLDKQTSLHNAFHRFTEELARLDGGMPNLHLGVITTDMGTLGTGSATFGPPIGQGPGACAMRGKDGVLQTSGSHVITTTDNFLSDIRTSTAERARNYSGTLEDAFTAISSVGAAGCGFEQPLAAIKASFAQANDVAFFRSQANLAVIVLSDEDDCSILNPALLSADPGLGPLQSYRCFSQGVQCAPDDTVDAGERTGCKPRVNNPFVDNVPPYADALLAAKDHDQRKVMFGAIVGDPGPVAIELRTPPGGGTALTTLAHSCSWAASGGGTAVADPAVRTAALVDSFPGRAKLASICHDDLAPALADLGTSVRHLAGDLCLEKAITDVATCIVLDKRDAEVASKQLPECPASGTPAEDCYRLVEDGARCTAASHLRLEIVRIAAPADDLWTTVRCTIAP